MNLSLKLSTNVLALLIFSVISLIVYYLLPKKARKIFLLVVSAVFYALCDLKMLAILVVSIVLTWYITIKISQKHSRKWLALGCTLLVALLVFFKYNEFFFKGVNAFLNLFGLGSSSGVLKLLMPLGISYYVFKSISYMVDVYKEKYDVERNLLNYALYVSLFTEILSGPISRYNEFKQSLDLSMNYSPQNMELGFYMIIRGLFMKGVIANRLSGYVGAIFATPEAYTGIALWLAAFFYAVQLYCDFAGYSSIAVGITQLFGLHYKENFMRPYCSTNIVEFWNRWHISLSSWLKDYVYIPLGGSRCSKPRTKLNIMIVFLVSGLWHGSGLNFIVWGLYHGVLNICTPRNTKKPTGIKKILLIFLTFIAVTFGWILFGTSSLGTAIIYIKSMFTNFSFSIASIQSAILPFTNDNTCIAFFLTSIFFIAVFAIRELWEERKKIQGTEVASIPWQIFLLVSVILFGNFTASGFIYANF